MKALCAILLAVALAAGIFLRFERLSVAPFHADEAVQAFIFKDLLEGGRYNYDPRHYHGPLPHYLNILWVKAAGFRSLVEMSEWDFRILPAMAGCLLVVAIGLAAGSTGSGAVAAVAALFAATSPLLVFFSRFGLHEMLFALLGFLASWSLIALLRKPTLSLAVALGSLTALMAACKETWIFFALAWALSAGLLYLGGQLPVDSLSRTARCLAAAVAVFFVVTFLLFGRSFPDLWRSYFLYQTQAGHDKPFPYYLTELFPRGRQWCGEPWLWLGAICFAGWIGWGRAKTRFPLVVAFLGCSGVATVLIFSFIPYKTPWLMVLPVALCLPAVSWLCVQHGRSRPAAVVIMGILGALLVWQTSCAWTVSQKKFWDSRIPLVYSPSSPNVPKLRDYLLTSCGSDQPIAVFGKDYWPLPWYLREFGKVGYFDNPQDRGDFAAFVFCGDHLDKRVSGTGNQEAIWGIRTDYLARTVVFLPRK